MASLTQDRIPVQAVPAGEASPPASLALPFAALVLGALAMGLSPIFVRWTAGEVGPFASAFWRVALALPVFFVWMRLDRASTMTGRGGRATALAGLAFTGDLFFWHLAILGTTVANATFFATTAPLFVVLATWLVLRRTVTRGTMAGLLLCLGGGAALVCESLAVAPSRISGDLFGIVTAAFFATYLLFTARARERASAARVSFWSTAVTAILLLGIALALDPSRFWPQRAETWWALIGLALVSQVAGQGLLAVALGRLPAVFSSLVIFLEAVFAATAGWIVLGERVSLVQAAGGALILVGIWIARPRRPRRDHSRPSRALAEGTR